MDYAEFPSEWAEDYRPSGIHPVHIDDEFKNGRYRVIRKLGYTSSSTVWLAVDNQNSQYVNLRILSIKDSPSSDAEVSIRNALAKKAKDDPLSQFVVQLLDFFQHEGPNGVHRCLAAEPIASTVTMMVNYLPENKNIKEARYPKAMAKKILKHIISGLAFLHKNGVVHGNVKTDHVVIGNACLNSVHEESLRQDHATISNLLNQTGGKLDQWGPRYIGRASMMKEYADLGPNMIVKVAELSQAFLADCPPPSISSSLPHRAPEIIFGMPLTAAIDIWAFGCLVYELITGTPLFSLLIMDGDQPEHADDDHILDMIDVLGPLPEDMKSDWPRVDKYFGPDGKRLRTIDEFESSTSESESDEPEFDATPTKELVAKANKSSSSLNETSQRKLVDSDLDALFGRNKPDDVGSEEARVITALLRTILRYRPAERPTASQLLEHPWFST